MRFNPLWLVVLVLGMVVLTSADTPKPITSPADLPALPFPSKVAEKPAETPKPATVLETLTKLRDAIAKQQAAVYVAASKMEPHSNTQFDWEIYGRWKSVRGAADAYADVLQALDGLIKAETPKPAEKK